MTMAALELTPRGNTLGDGVTVKIGDREPQFIPANQSVEVMVPCGHFDAPLSIEVKGFHGNGGPDLEAQKRPVTIRVSDQEHAVIEAMRATAEQERQTDVAQNAL